MKMNSYKEHNTGLSCWIFTVAEKMHLREAWIPCFLQWTVLFIHLTFPVADYVCDFYEELQSDINFFVFRFYCLLRAKMKQMET